MIQTPLIMFILLVLLGIYAEAAGKLKIRNTNILSVSIYRGVSIPAFSFINQLSLSQIISISISHFSNSNTQPVNNIYLLINGVLKEEKISTNKFLINSFHHKINQRGKYD